MADIIPLTIDTPKQLMMSMNSKNPEVYEEAQSMCYVLMDKDGDIYVGHNRMTVERMLYLSEMLREYALTI